MENKPMTGNRQQNDNNKTLKQRLLGAAVLVALAVIIIPELVKKPMPQTQITSVDMPGKPTLTVKLDPPEPQPLPPSGSAEQALPPATGDNRALAPSLAADATDPVNSLATLPSAEPQNTALPVSAGSGSMVNTLMPMPATPNRQSPTPSVDIDTTSKPPPVNPVTEPVVIRNATPPSATSAAAPRRSAPQTTASRTTTSRKPADDVNLPKIELISPRQYHGRQAAQAQRPSSVRNAPPATVMASNTGSYDAGRSNWVVQAGSFAVASNASLLRDQLRARDFPASLREVNVDGRTLYRVNVGPYTSRGEGEQARQRLLREASVKGSVRPMM